MNNIMLRIKTMYDDMGSGEKKIADWLLNHQNEVISLSISELAEECGCGEATIVRFAKRLGLEGYQELKISIAQESSGTGHIINESISGDDSCAVIFTKISNDIYSSLAHTKKVLNDHNMELAAKKILEADRIAIFGLGNSASIAIDAQHKFLRAGLNAAAYCDNHMQAIVASHLSKNDVVIGISHSGSSRDIVEAMKIAKEAGAATICITNFGKSPIIKQSDITLFTASEEIKYTIFGMYSRHAQLAIIDAIYIYVVLRKGEEGIKAVHNTERALQSKKY